MHWRLTKLQSKLKLRGSLRKATTSEIVVAFFNVVDIAGTHNYTFFESFIIIVSGC